jgi:hypothetical protein
MPTHRPLRPLAPPPGTLTLATYALVLCAAPLVLGYLILLLWS